MKKSLSFVTLIAAVAILFTGCLTCEKKEFTYQLNKDGSVNLTIKYYNLMSSFSGGSEESEESEEGAETAESTLEADFEDLMSNYVNGSSPESEYTNAVVETKRLFEENGTLCGEIRMKFASASDAKLFVDAKRKLILKDFCSSYSETLSVTNGSYDGSSPFVIWDTKAKTLTYTTSVSSAYTEGNTSLLSRWKNR